MISVRTFFVFTALSLLLAAAFAACSSDEGDPSSTDDPEPEGDYWENGYCPGASAEGVADYLPAAWECNGVSYEGCCDENDRVIWCAGGMLYCVPCVGETPFCSWMNPQEEGVGDYYGCTQTDNGEDPEGEHPRECDAGP